VVASNRAAIVLCRLGHYDEALQLYNTLPLVHQDLDVGWLYCNFGVTTYLSGDRETAIAAFAESLKIDPALFEARFNLGLGYYLTGEYHKAIAELSFLLEQQATSAETEIVQLRNHHRRPTTTSPELALRASLYKLRASAATQLKNYKAALEDAAMAVQLDRSDAATYEVRGTVWMLMNQWGRAKADFDQAIWLGADAADHALLSRGLVQLQLGSLAGAKEDFARAAQLNPSERQDAAFLEQWCHYCLDRQGRIQLRGNETGADTGWKRLSGAPTTTSRAVIAERLLDLSRLVSDTYWSILSGAVLDYLRNDFAQAHRELSRLEATFKASEHPDLRGWSYFYWLGLVHLTSNHREIARACFEKASSLGLPPVLLLDSMRLA
jgi:tetratricopeptide (TPR) repeat protein